VPPSSTGGLGELNSLRAALSGLAPIPGEGLFAGGSDYTRKEIQERRERDVTMLAAYCLDGIDLSDLNLSGCV